jgi:anti-anti-sigma factor
MPHPFALTIIPRDGGEILEASGDLDYATASALDAELHAAERRNLDSLVLDLTDLEFIDSMGLRVIFAAHDRAAGGGCRFAVVIGLGPARRIFALTQADRIIEILDGPAP